MLGSAVDHRYKHIKFLHFVAQDQVYIPSIFMFKLVNKFGGKRISLQWFNAEVTNSCHFFSSITICFEV